MCTAPRPMFQWGSFILRPAIIFWDVAHKSLQCTTLDTSSFGRPSFSLNVWRYPVISPLNMFRESFRNFLKYFGKTALFNAFWIFVSIPSAILLLNRSLHFIKQIDNSKWQAPISNLGCQWKVFREGGGEESGHYLRHSRQHDHPGLWGGVSHTCVRGEAWHLGSGDTQHQVCIDC